MIDLFCGTGAFAEGFAGQRDRYELAYAIDSEPLPSATARANHPTCVVETEDIRQKRPAHVQRAFGIDKVDVIIGGPPCQGYSSLRPNRSCEAEDERNDLYLHFAAYAEHFRPKVVVMENVVGLLTHRAGATLERILDAFDKMGYSVDWRILNAASFGVPQKRERFIMIAARDNAPVRFPTPTHHFDGRVIGYRDKSRFLRAPVSAPPALTVSDAIADLPPLTRGQQVTRYTRRARNPYQSERRVQSDFLTLHKAANHSDKMMRVIKLAGSSKSALPKNLVTSGFSSCYSRLSADEPSATITVKFQSPASSKCIHPSQDRTITPREAARIQSFDDSYVFVGPLTRVASQIGNAVPPLLGRAIADSVSEMIG